MRNKNTKNVVVLGSTGSIGVNTLKVLEAFPDRFRVVGLSAFSNIALLEQQIRKFKPLHAVIADAGNARKIKRSLSGGKTRISSGTEGLCEIAQSKNADIVVVAVSGAAAIYPLIAAIRSKKHICLANKESLVTAGGIIMKLAKQHRARIIPVDSEHSAIFQCIHAGGADEIKRLFLTGSGGPLHTVSRSSFAKLNIDQALKHPKWKMGRKITIDSATLMNKGLEVIEAHHLFDMPIDRIKLVIHPEAIIHSMCEFRDGSIIAQLGKTDMKLPIQYALSYPQRLKTPFKRLDFAKIKRLEFSEPDISKYPCYTLAMAAARLRGTATAVLNAANEVAVAAFLSKKICFTKIPRIVEKVMITHRYIASPSLDAIFQADQWSREKARSLIGPGIKV
jgi:1-deoxy-D-xylulose-5-phosphate reductoisomerase